MHSTARRTIAATGALAALIALAGCAPAEDEAAPPAESSELEIGAIDLSEACPSPVVIQTDWNPEAEHGWIYEMIGDDYEIDTDAVAVRGALVRPGGGCGAKHHRGGENGEQRGALWH